MFKSQENIPFSSHHTTHPTTSTIIHPYPNSKIHHPNFHGSLTIIHHPIINFSLLKPPKCQIHHSKHIPTKLEVPPHAIGFKLLRKKNGTKFSSNLGKSSKPFSLVVKYRHLGIDWLYFGQASLTLVDNYKRLNTKCPPSI